MSFHNSKIIDGMTFYDTYSLGVGTTQKRNKLIFTEHLPLVELRCTYNAGTCGSDKNFRMQSWLLFSSRASHNACVRK